MSHTPKQFMPQIFTQKVPIACWNCLSPWISPDSLPDSILAPSLSLNRGQKQGGRLEMHCKYSSVLMFWERCLFYHLTWQSATKHGSLLIATTFVQQLANGEFQHTTGDSEEIVWACSTIWHWSSTSSHATKSNFSAGYDRSSVHTLLYPCVGLKRFIVC